MISAARPKLDIDRTRERLVQFGCLYANEQMEAMLTEAVCKPVPTHGFLEVFLQAEIGGRESRRVKTSLRLSNLHTGQTLANFDFAFQLAIERSCIETLAACARVRDAETVLIQGPPGVGKTHLAIGLGINAGEHGFSAQCFQFHELLNELLADTT